MSNEGIKNAALRSKRMDRCKCLSMQITTYISRLYAMQMHIGLHDFKELMAQPNLGLHDCQGVVTGNSGSNPEWAHGDNSLAVNDLTREHSRRCEGC